MLSKQTIKELQVILREEFERDFSFSEATKIANAWVGYFDLLAKVDHSTNSKSTHE